MDSQSLLFGADGGGSKTIGIVAARSGKPLAEEHAGATNPNVVGIEGAARTLTELMMRCCQAAQRLPAEIGRAVLGLAGAGSPAIEERLMKALSAEFGRRGLSAPPITVVTDARVTLEGAFGGGPGIILIAGTGSIVLGKSWEGAVLRVGGWGRLLGDEGSGYAIGLDALKAVVRELDGGAPSGVLRRLLKERFGLTTREEIIAAVYQEQFPIASLAPVVLEAAGDGDRPSQDILTKSAEAIARQVALLARRISEREPLKLVFAGGLIDHETVYSAILKEALDRIVPGLLVRPAQLSPVEGAVLLARNQLEEEK